MSFTMTEEHIGQVGLSLKEKLSLIQQEQLSLLQVQTDVSSSSTTSLFFFEKYIQIPPDIASGLTKEKTAQQAVVYQLRM